MTDRENGEGRYEITSSASFAFYEFQYHENIKRDNIISLIQEAYDTGKRFECFLDLTCIEAPQLNEDGTYREIEPFKM